MKKETKQRPGAWVTGPDPEKHAMYLPFLRARAQAKFRNEEWTLTFDDYFALWQGNWHLRGHQGQQLCMTRHDIDSAWTRSNTFLITRSELQNKMHEYRQKHNIQRATRGPDTKPRKRKTK